MLGNVHAAEDAFQTTFLIFARKARSIRQEASLGSWLYGVAYRVAARMRGSARPRTGVPLEEIAAVADGPDHLLHRELRAVVDAELQHLPEKYRLPLVLCHLEELSHTQAALELMDVLVYRVEDAASVVVLKESWPCGLAASASVPLVGLGADFVGGGGVVGARTVRVPFIPACSWPGTEQ